MRLAAFFTLGPGIYPDQTDESRLRTHNQKMTVAAMQMALMNVWAQRS